MDLGGAAMSSLLAAVNISRFWCSFEAGTGASKLLKGQAKESTTFKSPGIKSDKNEHEQVSTLNQLPMYRGTYYRFVCKHGNFVLSSAAF
jgi:hypothetical protein